MSRTCTAWDAVFVDRDGTLNVSPAPGSYVLHPDELRLLPGAASAVGALNAAGVEVHVVTNQRCVARGLIDEPGLAAVHERLVALLAAEGAHLDSIQVCPHGADQCSCRKPADGLIRRVLEERPYLRAERCAVIGDSVSDVRAGDALGVVRVLLVAAGTSPGGPQASGIELSAASLAVAVDRMLAGATPPRNAPGGSRSAVPCAVDDTPGG
jgi:D-glycero-D-manno-heptose 1,7-bisphosphate phosphatase